MHIPAMPLSSRLSWQSVSWMVNSASTWQMGHSGPSLLSRARSFAKQQTCAKCYFIILQPSSFITSSDWLTFRLNLQIAQSRSPTLYLSSIFVYDSYTCIKLVTVLGSRPLVFRIVMASVFGSVMIPGESTSWSYSSQSSSISLRKV